MPKKTFDYLSLLNNHIDPIRIPFSDRGSRLLFFQYAERSAFYLKLAERLIFLDEDNEAYLKRPPFIQDLVLLDEGCQPLEFQVSSCPYRLTVETRKGVFEIVFQDVHTLAIGLPPDQVCGFRFRAFPQSWQINNGGGRLSSFRNLTYTTNTQVMQNRITPVAGGVEVELLVKSGKDSTITIDIFSDEQDALPIRPFSILRSDSKERWQKWFSAVPPVNPRFARAYAYAWWVMANNLISPQGNVLYESMAPSKTGYVGLWLWDSALHALAYRHVDAELARNQIRCMIAHQQPNGMLPDAVFDDGIVTSLDHPISGEVTKPPVLAWAALKLHETNPDEGFLTEIYPAMVRLNDWWFDRNDDDADGVIQYNHPYSSGLDDSPLWDQGMPVESPELNTYLCLQLNALARIAEILKKQEDAKTWRERSAALLQKMIDHFWDAEAGLFWVVKDHQPVKVVTPFNLYPLWTGRLPDEINTRLLDHLLDPREFWGEFPIPTVARSDPHYDPRRMWRGPVWVNINYFFIEALETIGRSDLADFLRERTLEMVMEQKDMAEFYNPENGKPPAGAVHTFGWTAALFIDLAIQTSRK